VNHRSIDPPGADGPPGVPADPGDALEERGSAGPATPAAEAADEPEVGSGDEEGTRGSSPDEAESVPSGAGKTGAAPPGQGRRPEPGVLGQPPDRPCSVELPQFEGPLDLLLHLVRRHELDILDIPISFVCEKYLEYLALMQSLDLEIAGDYLVMAATLAYLKSRELLPHNDKDDEQGDAEGEDGPDPREELIARLLEYQKYRAAAEQLDRLPLSGRDVFDRGGEIELPLVDPGLAPITMFRLAEAYQRILQRARIHKSHEVVLERVSVPQRMQQLTLILEGSSTVEFESLFLGRTWPSESELRAMLVVTLMSVLELTKLGIIFVRQEPGQDTITIERRTSVEEAQKLLSVYQGETGAAVEDVLPLDPEPDGHA